MNQTDTIGRAMANITAVLRDAEMVFQPFAPEDDATGFVITFAKSDEMGGLIYVFPEQEQFAFYLMMLRPIPVETIARVAALITRLNNELVVGNFELDYDERAVQFKVSLVFRGAELSQAFVRNAILAGLDGMRAYAKVIGDVAAGQQTVPVALAAVMRAGG
ncbi:MAG: YbjN domain-containing protein [Chloroflexota bacterium]